MPVSIEVNSREACCFHEAGHAIVAVCCGLRVTGIHVGRSHPFEAGLFAESGRSTEIVSLAGMAIEMGLVDAGLATWKGEVVVSKDQLLPHWSRTCLGDLRLWALARAERLGHDDPPLEGWTRRFQLEVAALSKYLGIAAAGPIALALAHDTWLSGEKIYELVASALPNGPGETLQRWIEQGYFDAEVGPA